jgi:hypothetical protein
MRTIKGCAVALLAALGCAAPPPTAAPVAGLTSSSTNENAYVPVGGTLPAGARLIVQIERPIGIGVSRVGERFTAHVARPVTGRDGRLVIPSGALARGYIADLRRESGGRPAIVTLAFEELQLPGGVTLPLRARVISSDVQAGVRGVRPVFVFAGGASGASLGGVLGFAEGSIAGPLVGAGAGSYVSLGMGQTRPVLPAGTAFGLELQQSLFVGARPFQ